MDDELRLKILDLMITARAMEERMVKMSKAGDGYFWLGGIGEEAFNVPLGLLARPGEGLDYDYFHFHYRNGATMAAMADQMGMEADWLPFAELCQMINSASDPFSGGRNFCNHYAYKPWNVCPTTSTIQTQCSVAPGTARAQKRHGGEGITIVTFGDAGTAEGDFHVGLNWATLPGWELPLLFICTNNEYGISTPYSEVHGQGRIRDIAKGFGIKTALVDGNDAEKSYAAIKKAMDHVRKKREPYFLEAEVSRLNGHSSSSGGNRIPPGHEEDPLETWRDTLIGKGLITEKDYKMKMDAAEKKMIEIRDRVRKEPAPNADSIYDHIFAEA